MKNCLKSPKPKKADRVMVSISLDKCAYQKLKRIAVESHRSVSAQGAFFIEKGVLPPALRTEQQAAL